MYSSNGTTTALGEHAARLTKLFRASLRGPVEPAPRWRRPSNATSTLGREKVKRNRKTDFCSKSALTIQMSVVNSDLSRKDATQSSEI